MTKVVDQKAYLKKYLRSSNDEKKKKKKKIKAVSTNVKIIDDDIDLNHLRPVDEGEFEILNATEDAPQIVGIVDERGPVDFADKRRWKIIADDGDGNVAVSCSQSRSRDVDNESISNDDFPKSIQKSSKIDSRESRNGNSNQTPPRKSREHSDDDFSPPRKAHSKKKSRKRKKSSSSESSSSSSSSSSDSPGSEFNRKRKSKSKRCTKNRGKKSADEDSDLSLPRTQKQRDSNDLSPPRSRKQKDSGAVGPKKYRDQSDSDMSPPRRPQESSRDSRRKTSDFDLDPPRRPQSHSSKRNSDFDRSPSRSRRRDSNEDLSPPRKPSRIPREFKSHKNEDSAMSSPRKSRREESKSDRRNRRSDSDLSPPRKSHNPDGKLSRRRGGSDSDLSPPRKSHNPDGKLSRRRGGSDSDLSPPRKSHNPDGKLSRRRGGSDSDLSPPRHRRRDEKNHRSNFQREKPEFSRQHQEQSSRRRNCRWQDDENRRKSPSPITDKRLTKTLDGKTAGLRDAKALKEETIALKRRERALFNEMSSEVSGEGQAPVLRDRKTGRRRDLAAEAADKREKEKEQAEIDEKYAKWGRGLKQVSDQTQKLQDDLYEMSKPLARYADDADLDSQQRAMEHAEDPMLAYIKDKQIKEGKREPDAPTYEGSFMPNRFGIKPGHRWDGVDRSNGYEKKWFDARNARTAVQEEAYKWSTADM
ncbi:BUD13 homolog isoform X3 [Fopius arisanus]|uniref:BUD13 homolog n=1 Tax=Fopius arisanus TaxID=64838 RepID=A0A9R1T0R9_9HYME|nr:PREDICTED: BUD13 homolog isoform X2 [Fopius arisanus]XP_011300686.1 PREDICTED: BUD13 homolog isoform X3 [Fopius arisanus]